MSLTLDHVGIVVNDIDKSLAVYKDMLNIEPIDLGIVNQAEQGLKFALVPLGKGLLEFLQPEGEPGYHGQRLRDHLAKRGEGLFHLSVFSDNYTEDIALLKEKGYEVDEDVVDFVGGVKLKFAFLQPDATSGVWIEIVDLASVPENMR